MFVSINGFAVLNDGVLRKRWKMMRKEYAKSKRRIHATDSHQELPFNYFDNEKMKFDSVYADLLKKLFIEMSLEEYQKVRIIIDARKHEGGKLAEKKFQKEIDKFLKNEFSNTHCVYKAVHSYLDVLVELADFVSNTFYKEYQTESNHIFENIGFRLIQIKNPL